MLFSSVVARAAEPPEPAQYRSLLADAVSEYDAHRFDEARALFRRANDMSPNARTLRGIGMASFELRDYVEAYRALQGALAEKRKPLTPDQRRQVEALLERTKAFTGHFALRTIPLDATVRIDGDAPVIEQDGRVTLGLGRHTIAVDAVGRIGELRELHVFGGENRDLAFQLRLIEPPLTPNPTGETPPAAPPAPDAEPHRSTYGWWLAGGGVLAAGAIVTGVIWHSDASELDKCTMNLANCRNKDALTTQRNGFQAATYALGIGALGLGITGVVLWARSATSDPAAKPPAVACAPSWEAISCLFVF
ncbi:MAG TPA: hypothetical protein VMU50_22475 [Polyangia bacterium]|nr:hypothetical protein [Polyangia bacterium]